MYRTKENNQHLQEKKQAILEGALHVFSRKGMAATMSDVAEAASVSQGLAYRYFANKEALFNELIEQTAKNGLALLQEIRTMAGTPGERLSFLVSQSLEGMHEYIGFYRLFAQVLLDETLSEDSHNLLQNYGNAYHKLMRDLIIAAQATGEVATDDPDQMLRVAIACLDGLLGIYSLEPSKEQFPETRIVMRIFKPC